jgi:hypothetical protein
MQGTKWTKVHYVEETRDVFGALMYAWPHGGQRNVIDRFMEVQIQAIRERDFDRVPWSAGNVLGARVPRRALPKVSR